MKPKCVKSHWVHSCAYSIKWRKWSKVNDAISVTRYANKVWKVIINSHVPEIEYQYAETAALNDNSLNIIVRTKAAKIRCYTLFFKRIHKIVLENNNYDGNYKYTQFMIHCIQLSCFF